MNLHYCASLVFQNVEMCLQLWIPKAVSARKAVQSCQGPDAICRCRKLVSAHIVVSLSYLWSNTRRKKNDVDNLFATFDPTEFENCRRFYPRWTGRRDKVRISRKTTFWEDGNFCFRTARSPRVCVSSRFTCTHAEGTRRSTSASSIPANVGLLPGKNVNPDPFKISMLFTVSRCTKQWPGSFYLSAHISLTPPLQHQFPALLPLLTSRTSRLVPCGLSEIIYNKLPRSLLLIIPKHSIPSLW